jgi:hypothetical protein
MTRVPPDAPHRPELQLRTHEPPRDTNDRLLQLAVFTEIDLTKGQYPMTRVLWREEFPDLEN